jgi:hypothetical protein
MEGSLVAYKVFSNGSVLNASEINENLMNQVTSVFSNAAARTAAITSPVEGQMTYLEDADRLELYSGSGWFSPFGLTLIKKQVMGTTVSTVTVTDAFSDSYDSYKIIITGGVASGNNNIAMRLGGVNTGYYASAQSITYAGVSSAYGGNNISNWVPAGYGSTNTNYMNVELHGPFLAKRTIFSSTSISPAAAGASLAVGGFQDSNTSFTDFTLLPQGGITLTGGTIYVYGYRKA